MRRGAAAAALTLVTAVNAVAQTPISDRSAPANGRGPEAVRAVGFYDATLRRVVLIGGAHEARAGVRDRVWSWTGSRWELVTDSGPPGRGNAGAAYDTRRGVAVVAGGARRAAHDTTFEVVSETWESTRSGWRRISGTDVTPRDHHSLVYAEDRRTVLMFGGILAHRSAPWPSDTWELRENGWTRVATEGPVGRGRTALAYDSKRRQGIRRRHVGVGWSAVARDQTIVG